MRFRPYFTIGIIFIGIIITTFAVYANYGKDSSRETFIMAFGDSLTYGKGDREEQGYVGKLERELNKKYPERKFIVENHGVKGRESGGILKELAIPGTTVKMKKADYFILFIGTNDLINSNGGNLENIDEERIQKGKKRYLRNVKLILDIFRKSNPDAPILVLGIYNPYPEGGGQIEPLFDEWNAATIKILKSEQNVTYVPTNDLFKGKEKEQYFSDSLHLNKKGYELLEERILQETSFGKNK